MTGKRDQSVRQMTLIDWLESQGSQQPEFRAGSLDCSAGVRIALRDSCDASGRTRDEIALRVSRLAGREVSANLLSLWSSDAHANNRVPAEVVPAICVATGSFSVAEALLSPIGCRMVRDETARLIELGAIEEQIQRLEQMRAEVIRTIREEGKR